MHNNVKATTLPGYTVFIPQKGFTFGMTSGNADRTLLNQSDSIINKELNRQYYTNPPNPKHEIDLLKYSPKSKKALNWVNGPNDMIYPQFIPGYQCYVPHIKADNIFGDTFAKSSQKAILNSHSKSIEPEDRYLSTFKKGHNENQYVRNYIDPQELKNRIDEKDCKTKFNIYQANSNLIKSSKNILNHIKLTYSDKASIKNSYLNTINRNNCGGSYIIHQTDKVEFK